MSLSVKTQGGSGGFFPSIWVNGLSETDTVYAAKDGKTVRGRWETRTIGEIEVSGFRIPLRELGLWTVTATDGVRTDTQDVLVDVALEFEIRMCLGNYLMLYDAGDECEYVTDGWGRLSHIQIDNSQYVYNETVTRGEDALTVKTVAAGSNSRGFSCFGAQESFDLSEYTMWGNVLDVVDATPNGDLMWRVYDESATVVNQSLKAANINAGNGQKIIVDISDLNNIGYLGFYIYILDTTKTQYISYSIKHSFLARADDWQALCSKAGISAPADLATLIANTTSIAAILANADAVKYMVTYCTGDFMASFSASSACRSALDASPYKAIVTANYHWAKFLAMLQ